MYVYMYTHTHTNIHKALCKGSMCIHLHFCLVAKAVLRIFLILNQKDAQKKTKYIICQNNDSNPVSMS